MEKIKQERYRDYYHYYPKSISLKSTEKILEQMRNIVCKINLLDGRQGIGFFCKIVYNNIIPVLITSYFLINEDILNRNKKISITINNKEKKILFKIG